MTSRINSLPATLSGAFARAITGVKRLLETAGTLIQSQRDRRLLRALDDRMLKDMGISRSDIDRVSRIPQTRTTRSTNQC